MTVAKNCYIYMLELKCSNIWTGHQTDLPCQLFDTESVLFPDEPMRKKLFIVLGINSQRVGMLRMIQRSMKRVICTKTLSKTQRDGEIRELLSCIKGPKLNVFDHINSRDLNIYNHVSNRRCDLNVIPIASCCGSPLFYQCPRSSHSHGLDSK